MRIFLVAFMLFPLLSFAQPMNYKGSAGGTLSLGMRSTLSTFNGHHDESNGFGVGGQFRLQFADQVNSDWFFDYIQSSIGDFANRTDYHIGWSVLFYPLKSKVSPMDITGAQSMIRPYLLAGHCFDYSNLYAVNNYANKEERWSSAVQAGLGTHWMIGPRFDVSLTGQYMIHLGNELAAHQHEDGTVEFHQETGSSMEGHLLFTLSLNYKIADLW